MWTKSRKVHILYILYPENHNTPQKNGKECDKTNKIVKKDVMKNK